jgi:two-component system, cell cycle sensor histidine kinase and response regulator CckA
MKEKNKTKAQLIDELAAMRQKIAELENSETELKQEKEIPWHSEEKYRALIEHASDAIIITDSKGNFLEVNKKAEDLLGYTSKELVSMNPRHIHPKEELKRIIHDFSRMAAGEMHSCYDTKILTKDGRLVPVDITGAPIEYNGKTLVQGIFRDITEYKKAEENLIESEERYRIAIEHSNDGVALIRGSQHIYVNEKFLEMFGYDKMDDIIGNPTFFTVHPDDREMVMEYNRKRQKGEPATPRYEYKAIKKDGTTIFIEVSATMTMYRGEPCSLAYLRDITERKRVEEELVVSRNRLSRAEIISHCGNWEFDLGLKRVFASEGARSIYGLLDREWTIQEVQKIPLPKYRGMLDDALMGLIKENRPYSVEFKIQRPDTGEIIDIYSIAEYNRDRNVVFGVIQDITERKRLETQLMHAQKMEAIGTLAGGIAHDFNNLLMGIRGYASLMLMEFDPSHPHYEKLTRIENQVQSGADLTKQLLGFARGGSYVVKPASMNELIEKTSTMFGRTTKEITIHCKYEKNIWVVEVDHGQIEQVFLNLYLNAWQAMPEGGDLSIETKNIVVGENHAKPYYMAPGRYVQTSISDTGVGMDEKTKERIFEPFFTTKELGRGTGLGLAMVYGIIKNHNGFIDVISEPGRGTTFVLYFPASKKDVVKDKPAPPEMIRGTETILIVDDEPDVLAVSKEFLESLGYSVYAVKNGEEATRLYKEKEDKIDLVVLDMIMPGLSGNETFDRIREVNPSAKIILSSGYSLNSQAQQIMDKGCHGFIQKPFDMTQISRLVREILDS